MIVPLLGASVFAQDAIPFIVAGELAVQRPDAVYSPTGHPFDPSPDFARRSCEMVPHGTDCDGVIVSYLSPPIALPLARALAAAGSTWGVVVMRLGSAAALVGGMLVLWRRLSVFGARAEKLLVISAALLTPFALVPIRLGQNSTLMFLSACLGVSAAVGPRRRAGAALAAAIFSAAVLFKLFPIALVPVLVWRRKWMILAFSILMLGLAMAVTAWMFPLSLFADFVDSSTGLVGTGDIPTNGAVLTIGRGIILPSEMSKSLGTMASAVLFLCAVIWYVLATRDVTDDLRWAAAWVAVIAPLPMLWWHYLWVAFAGVALGAEATAHRRGPAVLVALPVAAGVASVPALLQSAGYPQPALQALLYLAAMVAIGVLLRRGASPRATASTVPDPATA
jgi:hypothetical protein